MAFLLLSSPVYGYVLDRKGAYAALLLSLSVCGVGCLARYLHLFMNCYYENLF
jgi:MFS family permease